jgi:hypothetical protein
LAFPRDTEWAMSQENLEIVRRVWEAWERGSHRVAWADERRLGISRPRGIDPTTYHGKEGFLEQSVAE